MSSFNPLIHAPHVPPQTNTPKWGEFLENGQQPSSQQQKRTSCWSQSGNRQLQPIQWQQVKAAQQPLWAAPQPLRQQPWQPHINSSTAQQQPTSKQAQASGRWRQQQQHSALRPDQNVQPALDGGAAATDSIQADNTSWIQKKRAQQKAATRVGQSSAAESRVEQAQQPVSLQQQQQQQFLHPQEQQQHFAVPPVAGLRGTPPAGPRLATAVLPQPQQFVRHQQHPNAAQLWLDEDDDVQLFDDDDMPMPEQPQQYPTTAKQQQQQPMALQQGCQQQQQQLHSQHNEQLIFQQQSAKKARLRTVHEQGQQQQQQTLADARGYQQHGGGHSVTVNAAPLGGSCRLFGARQTMQNESMCAENLSRDDLWDDLAVPAGQIPQQHLQPPQQPQHQQQQRPQPQRQQHQQLHLSRPRPTWEDPAQQANQPVQLGPAARVNPAVASKWAVLGAVTAAQPLKVAKPVATRQKSAAVEADAAGADTVNHSSKPCRGRRRGSRGGKAGRSSMDTSKAANSNITMEFVPKSDGSGTSSDKARQDKMHQETIFQTLDRRNKKLQREQQHTEEQPQQDSNQQTADGITAAAQRDSKPGTAKGRKRKVTTEAAGSLAEAAPAVSGAAVSCAGSGGGSGRPQGSSRARKRPRKSAQAAAAAGTGLQDATETLDLWTVSSISSNGRKAADSAREAAGSAAGATPATCGIFGLNSHAAWEQLRQELHVAEGVALGLLMCQRAGQAMQYCSSLQPLSKDQQQLLKKHVRLSGKAASTAAGADADPDYCAEIVGLAFMPVGAAAASATAPQRANVSTAQSHNKTNVRPRMYYAHLPVGQAPGANAPQQQQQPLSADVLQLLSSVLSSPSGCPCVCSNAKSVLCSLAGLGMAVPAAGGLSVVDPELLGWLLDPQLVQDCKQTTCYSLQAQLDRLGQQQAAVSVGAVPPGPLQRLYQQLQQSVQLADLLLNRLNRTVAGDAIKLEMQVTAVLAKMELAGVGISPKYLLDHKATLLQRISAINNQAAAYAGRSFNLSSASQLAAVLYEDLKLPPPTAGGGRGSAKTHLPTDELSLKQLASIHPLPGLIIEYRCMQNVITKWMEPEWVQLATTQAAAAGNGCSDVHCSWNQVSTATGRLSSSSPNLQAVTKYIITAHQQQQATSSSPTARPCVLNIRDAFVARPGTVLLSADYSQIELRLLAHFSGDSLLRQLMHQSGSQGDVFKLIAAAWMQPGGASGDVDASTRERAKRVVYGIIYGLSAFGLSQQLSGQGVTVEGAEALINSFLNRFQGVRQFMSSCLVKAQSTGSVQTLLQRIRPIAGLTGGNHRDKSAAERKVVNSIVQGSAADLIKLAMRDWDNWAANQQPHRQQQADSPDASETTQGSTVTTVGARLIAQIHDELLFEVDASDAVLAADGGILAPGARLQHVAQVVRGIMAMDRLQLSVPLKVNISWGQRWGSMQELTAGWPASAAAT